MYYPLSRIHKTSLTMLTLDSIIVSMSRIFVYYVVSSYIKIIKYIKIKKITFVLSKVYTAYQKSRGKLETSQVVSSLPPN
jgi:hypothetical protein